MEGTHGQLGTRLTDGLSSDCTDCFTHFNRITCRQVDTVTVAANPMTSVTCKYAADGHFVHTSIDNFTGNIFGNQLIWTDDHRTSFRMFDSLLGVATLQTLFQRLDHLFAIGDRGDVQTTVGSTVVLTDDDILGHVNQTTSQIT